MNILITGGTGTLGKELTKQLLTYSNVKRIVIYSRDEYKQHEMMRQDQYSPAKNDDRIRYFVGDVRDEERLIQALDKCTHVIHAAALKQVPSCEYNPQEAIKTNVIGTMNVLSACNKKNITRCVVVSTDKAVQPVNLYGATKLCAEKLAVSFNSLGKCQVCVVRYGNVIGSRGSVIETWGKQAKSGEAITITSGEMTRFWIAIQAAAMFVIDKLYDTDRGTITVPKMTAMSMDGLAELNFPTATKKIVGVRPGEKLHEVLVSEHESYYARETEGAIVICPEHHEWSEKIECRGEPMMPGTTYNSQDEAKCISKQ